MNLCLDTGHISYCGGDNLAIIQRAPDRIGYLHLKQVDPEVGQGRGRGSTVRRGRQARRDDRTSARHTGHATAAGRSGKLGIDVFAIVEQDMYPCDVDTPLPIAQRTRRYLGSCGIPSVKFATNPRSRNAMSDLRIAVLGIGMMGADHVARITGRIRVPGSPS